MVKMKNVCNDRLADNPKLIKAAKLEAEKHLLPSNLTPTLKTTKGKTLSSEFQKLTKESRHFSAFKGIGAVAEGKDDEDLATSPPPPAHRGRHQNGVPKLPVKRHFLLTVVQKREKTQLLGKNYFMNYPLLHPL